MKHWFLPHQNCSWLERGEEEMLLWGQICISILSVWFLIINCMQDYHCWWKSEKNKKRSWGQIYFLILSSSTDLKNSWIGGGEEENAKLRPNLSSHSVAVVEERLFGQKQNQLWDQQLVVATVSGSNNGSSNISPAVMWKNKNKTNCGSNRQCINNNSSNSQLTDGKNERWGTQ